MKRHITTIFVLFLMHSIFYGQVTVDVNSGNPIFPFPQFKHYHNGLKNLGTNVPDGVSHAEMEETIKAAYQLMMNRANYTGETYEGVKYIEFKGVPVDDASESIAYALLAAAYMADKTTFDGIWMHLHDQAFIKSPRYSDCIIKNEDWPYENLPSWQLGEERASALDADEDIALALSVAYKQWGEFMGINDACGNPISYKAECLKILKAMTDYTQSPSNPNLIITGDIGYDGYIKSGNTWGETTNWAAQQQVYVEFGTSDEVFIDYAAPGYYTQFAKLLANEDATEYEHNIKQFQRAAASSDWLIGELNNQGLLPIAGKAKVTNDLVAFSNANFAEDIRLPWRNALNYMWHGAPSTTWNPVTHQPEEGANTFQYDMSLRLADFLKDPTQESYSNGCTKTHSNSGLDFKGISALGTDINLDGSMNNFYQTNWILGAGASAAVVSQDLDLMAKMYRNAEMLWIPEDTEKAKYFHGWFRLLGMLTLTGNMQAPSEMKAEPNVRVYLYVDSTLASINDPVEIHVDAINYGSVVAENAEIKITIPNGIEVGYISDKGVYNPGGQTVDYKITIDERADFRVAGKIKEIASGTLCPEAIVSLNGKTSSSNQTIPNRMHEGYDYTCIDIFKPEMYINKTANVTEVSTGDEVEFTIEYQAKAWEQPTGGRPGVTFSFASTQNDDVTNNITIKAFHDADEAYIDYSNYRFTYFVYDEDDQDWVFETLNMAGVEDDYIRKSIKDHSLFEDGNGRSNKSFTFRPDFGSISGATAILERLTGTDWVHKGLNQSMEFTISMRKENYASRNWEEDWSYDNATFAENLYNPITPSYSFTGETPVSTYGDDICNTPVNTTSQILVEEYVGGIWRKVAGNAPFSMATDAYLHLEETIPDELEFVEFIGDLPEGVSVVFNDQTFEFRISEKAYGKPYTFKYKAKVRESISEKKTVQAKAMITSWGVEKVSSAVELTLLPEENPMFIEFETTPADKGERNGKIVATVTGGSVPYTYEWEYNSSTSNIVDDAYNTSYKLIVTDSRGVTKTATVVLKEESDQQVVDLKKGWNMVSIYITPTDNDVRAVFPDAVSVKTFNSFFKADQEDFLNNLETIETGVGYMVLVDEDVTVTIEGTIENDATTTVLKQGWNLVGIPVGSPVSIDNLPGQILIIKNYEDYYSVENTLNSLTEILPGEAYFIKTEDACEISW